MIYTEVYAYVNSREGAVTKWSIVLGWRLQVVLHRP